MVLASSREVRRPALSLFSFLSSLSLSVSVLLTRGVQLETANDTIARQKSEIERLNVELQAAYANVTAARAACEAVDRQRDAAVKSVSKALARLRDAEMAWAEDRERWEAELSVARGETWTQFTVPDV